MDIEVHGQVIHDHGPVRFRQRWQSLFFRHPVYYFLPAFPGQSLLFDDGKRVAGVAGMPREVPAGTFGPIRTKGVSRAIAVIGAVTGLTLGGHPLPVFLLEG